jgi:hypothetical protein
MRPIKIIFSFLIIASLQSCKNWRKTEYVHTFSEVIETIRDTIFTVQADTASIHYHIVCDSNGIATLGIPVFQYTNRHIKPEVRIEDNVLIVDCTTQARELYVQWKERYANYQKNQIVTVPAELTGWQWFQIWFGRISLMLLAVFTAIKAYDYYSQKSKIYRNGKSKW